MTACLVQAAPAVERQLGKGSMIEVGVLLQSYDRNHETTNCINQQSVFLC